MLKNIGTYTAEAEFLAKTLSGASLEGVDLGPRESHIRSIGAALEHLVETTRAKILEFDDPVQFKALSLVLADLAILSNTARNFRYEERHIN